MIPDIIDNETNLRNLDRILRLEVEDNKKPKSTLGTVDTRLFTGGQELHLKMDIQSNLWSFRYSNNGILPDPLKGVFTTFKKGYDVAKDYYARRNVRIAEVLD